MPTKDSFKEYCLSDQACSDCGMGLCGTLALVEALTAALDAKNSYTRGHSDRVAEISSAIAAELGLSIEEIHRVHVAGHLHDIGKIGISDAIITKDGPLSQEEFAEMKRHPVIGDELLAKVPALDSFRLAVRHHHERWDGQGYPDGLKAEAIPFFARIICVADAFDAMTTTRSYRTRLSPRHALMEIQRCSGSQFDPQVSLALCSCIARGDARLAIAEGASSESHC